MNRVRDGDIYKILRIGGEEIIIRYGFDTLTPHTVCGEPEPIFPDFLKAPRYTVKGEPIVTADQDVCSHYLPKARVSGEDWCNDCLYFTPGEEAIGLCSCMARRCILRHNE